MSFELILTPTAGQECQRGCGRYATACLPDTKNGGGWRWPGGAHGPWIRVCEDYYKRMPGCVPDESEGYPPVQK